MALSPSIPTSFVPKQPVTPTGTKKYSSSGTSIFLIIGIVIFVLAIAAAVGTFAYDKILQKESDAKAQQILAKENTTATTTLSDLVSLQDRLSAAESVITQHIALTQFFTLLGNITANDVSFKNVSITVNADRSADISLGGTAQDFNALENESLIFDQQTQYIKNPIFSGFVLNKDNTVSFTVTATLDPSLVKENTLPPQNGTTTFVPSTASSPSVSLPSAPAATADATTSNSSGTSDTPDTSMPVTTDTSAPSDTASASSTPTQ